MSEEQAAKTVFQITGPPVTREMQTLFAPYDGSPVVSVTALREGLHVTYESGRAMTFVAVPTGAALYVDKEGKFAVAEVAHGD